MNNKNDHNYQGDNNGDQEEEDGSLSDDAVDVGDNNDDHHSAHPQPAQSQPSPSPAVAASSSSDMFLDSCQDAAAIQDLQRSNLLRLQMEQMVETTQLELNTNTNAHSVEIINAPVFGVANWADTAVAYVQCIADWIVQTCHVKHNPHDDAPPPPPPPLQPTPSCPFRFFSDRAAAGTLHVPAIHITTHIPQHQTNAMTKPAGNAHVLPTLQLHVLLQDEMFEAKDWIRYRYTDKRNLVVWYVAQQLAAATADASTADSNSMGHVYWEYQHGDPRQPILMLVPATTTIQTENNKHPHDRIIRKKVKTQRRYSTTATTKSSSSSSRPSLSLPLTKKLRFRVQILFGMASLDWVIASSPLRLLPNRCNLARQQPQPQAPPNDGQKNNIKKKKSDATTSQKKESWICSHNNNNALSSSQFYNQVVLEDAAWKFWQQDCYPTDKDNDESSLSFTHPQPSRHFVQAVILLQIWALQRGLLRNHDGFNGGGGASQQHDIILLLHYLIRTKQANVRMAAPQLLAAFFKLVADTDWLGEGSSSSSSSENAGHANRIRKAPSDKYRPPATTSQAAHKQKRRTVLVMPKRAGYSIHQTAAQSEMANLYAEHTRTSPLTDHDPPTLLEFYADCQQYRTGPVFLDSSMTYNYAGRWSPSFCRVLQHEARTSLSLLHRAAETKSFEAIFCTPARFWQRHDAYLQIPIAALDMGKYERHELQLWGHDGQNFQDDPNDLGEYEYLARGIVRVLTAALGDRVTAVRLLSTGNGNVVAMKQQQQQQENAVGAVDSDNIPRHKVIAGKTSVGSTTGQGGELVLSPTGSDSIVIGVSINPDTCYRLVDRGPPADDAEATKHFLSLWGKDKAELRRFRDGAIVHAVVWGKTSDNDDIQDDEDHVQFQNDDTIQGAIVERIIRHVLRLHFLRKKALTTTSLQFALRNMVSTVDSVIQRESPEDTAFLNPTAAHRMVMKAFDALSDFLRKYSLPTVPISGTTEMKSRLGIPLPIDAVEPLGPALRYAAIHPPLPHPLLGGKALPGVKRVSGAIQYEPIKIQIRFGVSSKWPSDLRAIGAAKTAMLIQLCNGIETMKQSGHCAEEFDGPAIVTPAYADIGFMGYVFRVMVRADREIKLLQSLVKPSHEAVSHLRFLTHRHVVAATHHSLVHAVYTSHPSSSAVVRMAKKWISSHLLTDLIPFEALELIVCHAYTDPSSPFDPPGTAVAGFFRFLHVLAGYDWQREPMIVDPQCQFTQDDKDSILDAFQKARGPNSDTGPAMYIVSPTARSDKDDEVWLLMPSFTAVHPERVVLKRASALASRSYSFLEKQLESGVGDTGSWASAFQETPSSFRSYSALFRVDPELLVDTESSSTGSSMDIQLNNQGELESSYMRSMKNLMDGPRELRVKLYRNLVQDRQRPLLLEWRAVPEMVHTLRMKLGHLALFFYNDLCPVVVAVLWRPMGAPHAFSAMQSEYMRPVLQDKWKADTLTCRNVCDLLREAAQYTAGIVVDTKIFDWGPQPEPPELSLWKKRKAQGSDEESASSDDD